MVHFNQLISHLENMLHRKRGRESEKKSKKTTRKLKGQTISTKGSEMWEKGGGCRWFMKDLLKTIKRRWTLKQHINMDLFIFSLWTFDNIYFRSSKMPWFTTLYGYATWSINIIFLKCYIDLRYTCFAHYYLLIFYLRSRSFNIQIAHLLAFNSVFLLP